MSGPKLDFKEWLAQQEGAARKAASHKAVVDQWLADISALFKQIRQWLAEDDTNKVLKISTGRLKRQEEGLGSYEAPTLSISLYDSSVDIIPVARQVVGGVGIRGDLGFRAEGRVDLTDGANKYRLYQAVNPDGRKWVIIDDDTYTAQELTKQTLEDAVQDLLS